MEGCTVLQMIDNATLSAIRYQDESLRPIVRPFAGAVGPAFHLVCDNTWPHVVRVCSQLPEDEGIIVDWSPCSPDLNPIENPWDIMFDCPDCPVAQ